MECVSRFGFGPANTLYQFVFVFLFRLPQSPMRETTILFLLLPCASRSRLKMKLDAAGRRTNTIGPYSASRNQALMGEGQDAYKTQATMNTKSLTELLNAHGSTDLLAHGSTDLLFIGSLSGPQGSPRLEAC